MSLDFEIAASGLDVAGRAILGDREEQQDRMSGMVRRDGSLVLVLADGMGGHEGGAFAAETAVREVLADPVSGTSEPAAWLVGAHARANSALARAKAEGGDGLYRSGSTLVIAFIEGSELHFLSIGDSLLLLRRGHNLMRLNQDHSMASILSEMVRDGTMTQDEADRDPRGNMLLSALTGEEPDLIHAPDSPIVLLDGDRLILASDGLLALQPDEIAAIAVREADAAACAAKLLVETRAAQSASLDNTSVIVCDVTRD